MPNEYVNLLVAAVARRATLPLNEIPTNYSVCHRSVQNVHTLWTLVFLLHLQSVHFLVSFHAIPAYGWKSCQKVVSNMLAKHRGLWTFVILDFRHSKQLPGL
jgi:hypothetical protein